eukprot:maker-scaffold1255_size84902-snap-gene-0.16 protein:Tk08544 transcript:maker-scaffold1255_size84902-snap-gene-0.16-mRNA-1 annotation:"Unknown (protein for MGC:185875)"
MKIIKGSAGAQLGALTGPDDVTHSTPEDIIRAMASAHFPGTPLKMGPRGLESYVEGNGLLRPINLAKYGGSTEERQPIIVEMNSMDRKLCEGLDLVMGGESQACHEKRKEFVHKIRAANLEPIIAVVGRVAKIRKKWEKKQQERLGVVEWAMAALQQDGQILPIDSAKLTTPRCDGKYLLDQELECKVIVTTDLYGSEAIARLAIEEKAVAILSQNTDFAIYDTKIPYVSVKYLNLDDLSAEEFTRETLAEKLNIRAQELPLLQLVADNWSISNPKANNYSGTQSKMSLHDAAQWIAQKKFPYGMSLDQLLTYISQSDFKGDLEEGFQEILDGYKSGQTMSLAFGANPPVELPSLLDLLDPTQTELNEIRWMLLTYIQCPQLDPKVVQALPPRDAVLVLMLSALLTERDSKKRMKPHEAHAFNIQYLALPHLALTELGEFKGRQNVATLRGVALATRFQYFTNIELSLQLTGRVIPIEAMVITGLFHGPLFQCVRYGLEQFDTELDSFMEKHQVNLEQLDRLDSILPKFGGKAQLAFKRN